MIQCWQYKMKTNPDIDSIWFSQYELDNLKVSDFNFFPIINENKKKESREFIKKYEWMQSIPPYPTHYFGTEYKDILGGVLIYSMPNAFTKLLGENTKNLERLLSRGATAGWTPKNLASSLIMWSIKWMVKNTQYRIFTAYSDPEAGELGTIYQACGWWYLGKTSGTKYRYREPGSDKWVSGRKFTSTSSLKKYARELNIKWGNNWSTGRKIFWENIPEEVKLLFKDKAKEKIEQCEIKEVSLKHKYAYVKGKTKKETNELLNVFFYLNPKVTKNYPKSRGE